MSCVTTLRGVLNTVPLSSHEVKIMAAFRNLVAQHYYNEDEDEAGTVEHDGRVMYTKQNLRLLYFSPVARSNSNVYFNSVFSIYSFDLARVKKGIGSYVIPRFTVFRLIKKFVLEGGPC